MADPYPIPGKKFDFPGFEGHTELFGHHPFMWKTPTPPEKFPDSKVWVCALFFRARQKELSSHYEIRSPLRGKLSSSQENGLRTSCATIANHSVTVNPLHVVDLLRVVFLVRWGPLGINVPQIQSLGPAPLQECVGDFCCIKFGGFQEEFSGGFFWALCPHKNEEKKVRQQNLRKNPAAQQ